MKKSSANHKPQTVKFVPRQNQTRRVIDALGGTRAVMDELDVTRISICAWVRMDKIPADAAIRLYYMARAKGLAVTLDDIFHYLDCVELQQSMLTGSDELIEEAHG